MCRDLFKLNDWGLNRASITVKKDTESKMGMLRRTVEHIHDKEQFFRSVYRTRFGPHYQNEALNKIIEENNNDKKKKPCEKCKKAQEQAAKAPAPSQAQGEAPAKVQGQDRGQA